MPDFDLSHGPAFLNVARCNGGVVVGCQIQVDGLRIIDAVFIADVKTGEQQTGGSTIINREPYPGGIEYRYILDFQSHMFGIGDPGFRIDVKFTADQAPGFAAWFAGGVSGVIDVENIIDSLGLRRRTAHSGFVEQVTGLFNLHVLGVHVDLSAVASHQQSRFAELYVAFKIDDACILVGCGAVASNLTVTLGQLDVATQAGNVFLLHFCRC